MMLPLSRVSPYTSLIAFVLGLPTAAATYYQAWKARQEAAQARAGLIYSRNCLEFVLGDGRVVNKVPLETLQHSLPKPGDMVLLPGTGEVEAAMGAFRVGRIEYIFTRPEGRLQDPMQARLVKAVAHVEGLFEEMEDEYVLPDGPSEQRAVPS